jgi:hypothetical protein
MDDNLAIWFEKKAFKNANNNLGWSAFSSKRLFFDEKALHPIWNIGILKIVAN